MWMFYVGAPALALFAAYCIWRVRAEYEAQRNLSRSTSLAVWILYILETGFTAYAAWRGIGRLPISRPISTLIGGVLLVIGSGIVLAGILEFHSLQRMSGLEADELVTSGIYRWSRNPQNVGWFLGLLGIALIVHIYTVYVEEPYLEQVYGQAYRDYRASTPRYLGIPQD